MDQRVLLIDDDAELCGLVTRFMAGEGFEVDSVTNGRQGVPRALSGGYKLILLDVMMPDMNGFEVLRRIRAESRIPVLMLTAKGDTLDRVSVWKWERTTTFRSPSIRLNLPPAFERS
jgi:DNA-binding response OmpR family regulator